MSTSQVGVYNLALSNIVAENFVQSLEEDSVERITCDANFQPSLDEVLGDHDWGFASKYELLAVIKSSTDTVPPPLPWIFEYEYPANCVHVREIAKDADNEDEVPFSIGLNDENTGRVIYSDKAQARARFTRSITNTEILSPKAIIALGWKLATRIVTPLVGNLELKETAENEYRNSINQAKRFDFDEGVNRKPKDPESITSRN
jgi:hypothetical protein